MRSTLQHTATHRNTTRIVLIGYSYIYRSLLQKRPIKVLIGYSLLHSAAHCAAHYTPLQHTTQSAHGLCTDRLRSRLQHTTSHCNILHQIATHHTETTTHYIPLQHTTQSALGIFGRYSKETSKNKSQRDLSQRRLKETFQIK